MSLEVKNIKYSYKDKQVLKNISFTLKKGDCIAVLGTNGVGKSTLLKCINNILYINDGEIILKNKNINEYSQINLAKEISYISQSSSFSNSSVFDSVLLGRRPYIKWNYSKRDLLKTSENLTLLNLNEYSSKTVSKLSGGERQKVSIARALNQDTQILLFDEPTSNLDPKNQVEILNIINDLKTKQDKSIIITLHDLNQAIHVANKFLLISDGKVLDFGTKEILTKDNLFKLYGINITMLQDQTHNIFITHT